MEIDKWVNDLLWFISRKQSIKFVENDQSCIEGRGTIRNSFYCLSHGILQIMQQLSFDNFAISKK